jgi:hypothetical protein
MNTGLQDAYNLGWKLALVVGDRADPALLESYERERLPVAQRLLDTTDRAFRLVVSDSRLAGLFRTRVLARLAAFALGRTRVQRFAFRTVSQTGIHYRASPLSESLDGLPDDAPRGGDRFPWLRVKLSAGGPVTDLFDALDDLHFQLLAFGQPTPVDWPLQGQSDRVRVHAIPADFGNDAQLRRARIPVPSFYLLRPDGHVGTCGVHWDARAVDHYLSGRLSLRARTP